MKFIIIGTTMKAKDTETPYIACETTRLIGDIVGSQELGARIVNSIFVSDESPSERNIQARLREALSAGHLQVKGLGPKGLKRLHSALLLGKTLYLNLPEIGSVVDSPKIAAQAFHEIAWEPVEKFAVMALDVKHRVLSVRVMFSGTATETYAHPREIFKWVMQVGGTRCIMAHNHPSGGSEPSEVDLHLTKQLIEAGECLGILVLDHMVLAGKDFTSIRQGSDLWVN